MAEKTYLYVIVEILDDGTKIIYSDENPEGKESNESEFGIFSKLGLRRFKLQSSVHKSFTGETTHIFVKEL